MSHEMEIPISGPLEFSLSENKDCRVIFVNVEADPAGGVLVELIHNADTGQTWFEQRVHGSLVTSIFRLGKPVVVGRLTKRHSRTDVETPWRLAPLTADESAMAEQWAREHLVRIPTGEVEIRYDAFDAS